VRELLGGRGHAVRQAPGVVDQAAAARAHEVVTDRCPAVEPSRLVA